jgi:hypothetical protein
MMWVLKETGRVMGEIGGVKNIIIENNNTQTIITGKTK